MTFTTGNSSILLSEIAYQLKALRASIPQAGSNAIGFAVAMAEYSVIYKSNNFASHYQLIKRGNVVQKSPTISIPGSLNHLIFDQILVGLDQSLTPMITVPISGNFIYRQFVILDSEKPFTQSYRCNGREVIAPKNFKEVYPVNVPFYVDSIVDAGTESGIQIEAKSHTGELAILHPFVLIPSSLG